jgi:hypothetical protein
MLSSPVNSVLVLNKKDEIGGTCRMRAIFIGKLQGKIPLGNLNIYEKIILKSNLEKYNIIL